MMRNLIRLMVEETDIASLMNGEIVAVKGQVNTIPIESSKHDYSTYMFSYFFSFLLAFDYLKQKEKERVLIFSDISGSEVQGVLSSLINFRNSNIEEPKVNPLLINEERLIKVTANTIERVDVLTQTPHLFTLGAGCTKLCTQIIDEIKDRYGLIIFSSLIATLSPIPFTDGSILLRSLLSLRNLAEEVGATVIIVYNKGTEDIWNYIVASNLEYEKSNVINKALEGIIGKFSYPYMRTISKERLYRYAMNFEFDKHLNDEIVKKTKKDKRIPDLPDSAF